MHLTIDTNILVNGFQELSCPYLTILYVIRHHQDLVIYYFCTI